MKFMQEHKKAVIFFSVAIGLYVGYRVIKAKKEGRLSSITSGMFSGTNAYKH